MSIRKNLFVSILIAGALTFSIAVDSSYAGGFGESSNCCAIWSHTFSAGKHLVSFPVLPSPPTLENTFEYQLPGGDSWDNSSRILELTENGYIGSFYNYSTYDWEGDINTLDTKKAYWLIIPPNSHDVKITLIGASILRDTLTQGEFTQGIHLVAAPEIYPVSIAASGLIESGIGFDDNVAFSDKIYRWNGVELVKTWFSESNGIEGENFNLAPWSGYILELTPSNEGFIWFYEGQENLSFPVTNNYGDTGENLNSKRSLR